MTAAVSVMKPVPKIFSHFSIDSILRNNKDVEFKKPGKEEVIEVSKSSKATEQIEHLGELRLDSSSKNSCSPTCSELSHHDDDSPVKNKKTRLNEYMATSTVAMTSRDYLGASSSNDSSLCSNLGTTSALRDELPLPTLENRHRLTEHWVYQNHCRQQQPHQNSNIPLPPPPLASYNSSRRDIPILRPNHYPVKRNHSFSSTSSDVDLIPSPSPNWCHNESIKRQPLDYLLFDRMLTRNNGSPAFPTSVPRHRSSSFTEPGIHPLRYCWSGLRDDRDSYPGLHLPRSPRMKTNLMMEDDDSDEGNRKGGQVRFSHTQSTELERVFSLQKYVSPQERKQLARSIDLSERQVKTWFQNRRAKWRRIKLEDEMRVRMGEGKNTVTLQQQKPKQHSLTSAINTSHHQSELNKPPPSHITKTEFRLDLRVREDSRVC